MSNLTILQRLKHMELIVFQHLKNQNHIKNKYILLLFMVALIISRPPSKIKK
jgi:hypothetical protein